MKIRTLELEIAYSSWIKYLVYRWGFCKTISYLTAIKAKAFKYWGEIFRFILIYVYWIR